MDACSELQEPGGARKPGRPRCTAVEASIKAAALELIAEVGFANLTMEGIATKAGVGKASIYRWWPNKSRLVIDAFLCQYNEQISFPDTGNVRDDLVQQMEGLVRLFLAKEGRIVAELIGAAQSDSVMARELKDRWVDLRRNAASQVLQKGIDRGELPADIDCNVLLAALYGPIYMRLLIPVEPMEPDFAKKIVDTVFDGASIGSPSPA